MKHVSRRHPGSGLRHPGNLGGHRVFSLRLSGLMVPPSAAARCDLDRASRKPDCSLFISGETTGVAVSARCTSMPLAEDNIAAHLVTAARVDYAETTAGERGTRVPRPVPMIVWLVFGHVLR